MTESERGWHGKPLAVVGLGPMGLRHLKAAKLPSALNIVGACDTREEARLRAKAEHPGVLIYQDLEHLLDKAKPEIVVIATNGPSHASIALRAMAGGVRHTEPEILLHLAEAGGRATAAARRSD